MVVSWVIGVPRLLSYMKKDRDFPWHQAAIKGYPHDELAWMVPTCSSLSPWSLWFAAKKTWRHVQQIILSALQMLPIQCQFITNCLIRLNKWWSSQWTKRKSTFSKSFNFPASMADTMFIIPSNIRPNKMIMPLCCFLFPCARWLFIESWANK